MECILFGAHLKLKCVCADGNKMEAHNKLYGQAVPSSNIVVRKDVCHNLAHVIRMNHSKLFNSFLIAT